MSESILPKKQKKPRKTKKIQEEERIPITYAYIRKSTIKQENSFDVQVFEIKEHCAKNNLPLLDENIVIDDVVSGGVNWKDRKIYGIIEKCKKGDTVVCYDISRISRSVRDLQDIVRVVIDKKCSIVGIKNFQFTIDDSMQCHMHVLMMGMCAEMERRAVSYRTKSALQEVKRKCEKLKEEGKFSGICGEVRKIKDENGEIKQVPRKGTKYASKLKLYEDKIREHIENGKGTAFIAEQLEITPPTVRKYINMIYPDGVSWIKRKKSP